MSHLSRAVAIAVTSLVLLSPTALASTWEAPVVVAPAATTGTASFAPVVAADAKGKLTAAWTGEGPAGFGVWTATRPASLTGPWSAPVRLSAALTPSALRLAVNASGQAIVGWVDTFPNRTQRVVTVNRSAADAWSAPTAIATTPSTTILTKYRGHELQLDPTGRATGVWFADETSQFGSITQQPSSSPTLGTSAPATNTNGDQGSPFDLAIDGAGNVTVLYLGADGLSVLSSTRSSGGAWQTPQFVEQWGPTNDAGEALIRPRLAVNANGHAAAVWLRGQHASENAQVIGVQGSTRAPGGSWKAPTTLEPLGDQLITSADVGIDSGGKATAAWDISVFEPFLAIQTIIAWTEVRARTTSTAGMWAPVETPGDRRQLTFSMLFPPPTSQMTFFGAVKVAVGAGGSSAATWVAATEKSTTLQAAVRRDTGSWEQPVSLAPLTLLPDSEGSEEPEDSEVGRFWSAVIDDAGRATVVWVDGRATFSRSTALATLPIDLAPVDPTPATPLPATPEPTKPEPTTPGTANPSPFIPSPLKQDASTPVATKPQTAPTSKLVVALYIVPTGRKCPALANGTVAGVRTPLKVKAAKIRGKLRCKVTGVIVLTTAVKAGTKVDVLVTAKGVKRKSVQFPAA